MFLSKNVINIDLFPEYDQRKTWSYRIDIKSKLLKKPFLCRIFVKNNLAFVNYLSRLYFMFNKRL